MLAVLRRRPVFRRLFLAHAVSRAGDAFNTVALVVLVFRLTGSGIGVAGTVVFEVLPVLLLGPFAGLVADRFDRRRVMVAADLARMVLAATLALAHGSVAVAYTVAFGLATGSLLFNPAASALVPDTVEDDELVDANAALWTVAVVAQILLAPTAGALIASVGVGAAFGINAASFLVSALFLRGLPAGRQPAADFTQKGWAAVVAGLDAVRSHPLLARLAVVQVLAALSAGATSGLLVVLASDDRAAGRCAALEAAAAPYKTELHGSRGPPPGRRPAGDHRARTATTRPAVVGGAKPHTHEEPRRRRRPRALTADVHEAGGPTARSGHRSGATVPAQRAESGAPTPARHRHLRGG